MSFQSIKAFFSTEIPVLSGPMVSVLRDNELTKDFYKALDNPEHLVSVDGKRYRVVRVGQQSVSGKR